MTNHVKVKLKYLHPKHETIECSQFSVGSLTNEEFSSLLHDNGIRVNRSDEDYYQLFSKFDRQLRDQFNYTELLRTIINTIMS